MGLETHATWHGSPLPPLVRPLFSAARPVIHACAANQSPATLRGSTPMADPLSERLKLLIVETLHLEDITPAQIGDDNPLIGSGLSLDSIDALELVVKIEKEYGIKIASAEESKQALASVASLAAFICERADPAKLDS